MAMALDPDETVRRNSILRRLPTPDGEVVEKRYTDVYDVGSEADAFSRLAAALADVPGVRAAEVVSVTDDAIRTAYVPGGTLAEAVARDWDVLGRHRGALVAALLALREHDLHVDFDMTNLLTDREGGLVVIDPVCVSLPLREFNVAVLLTSLLKVSVQSGSPRRGWAEARRLVEAYHLATGVARSGVYRSWSRYCDQVAEWNLGATSQEGRGRRLVRVAGFAPAWRTIAWALRVLAARRSRLDARPVGGAPKL